jgi:hypothetical protein
MPAPTSVLYCRDLLGRLVAAGTAADPKAFGFERNRDGIFLGSNKNPTRIY